MGKENIQGIKKQPGKLLQYALSDCPTIQYIKKNGIKNNLK